jgi:multiple sugar transport system ATP-binding protein
MAEIKVENLHKSFGEFAAVKNSNFLVENGDFVVLLGPSGCGKTTTLRMIAGLELPSSGRILLGGEDVTFKRAAERDIAFVFQMFALYPHMNVRANIGFSLKCEGVAKAEIRRRVEETARILRIDHMLDSSVSGLSSGDRQRVALGRAIVREPKCFLMDEPLGALDSEFRHVMCGELRSLHNRLKATTVYVTHDQLEAMSMADKIAVMNKGVIEQFGTPQEIYQRPVSMFVADFMGSPPMNFLHFESGIAKGSATVQLGDASVAMPAVHEDVAPAKLALGVRPEHIRFDDGSPLRGEVYGTEYLGTTQVVTVDTAFGQVKARTNSETAVKPGSQVGLRLEAPRLSLFRAEDGRAIPSKLYEGATHG